MTRHAKLAAGIAAFATLTLVVGCANTASPEPAESTSAPASTSTETTAPTQTATPEPTETASTPEPEPVAWDDPATCSAFVSETVNLTLAEVEATVGIYDDWWDPAITAATSDRIMCAWSTESWGYHPVYTAGYARIDPAITDLVIEQLLAGGAWEIVEETESATVLGQPAELRYAPVTPPDGEGPEIDYFPGYRFAGGEVWYAEAVRELPSLTTPAGG